MALDRHATAAAAAMSWRLARGLSRIPVALAAALAAGSGLSAEKSHASDVNILPTAPRASGVATGMIGAIGNTPLIGESLCAHPLCTVAIARPRRTDFAVRVDRMPHSCQG
jgi:hypothetical protein